MVNPERFYEEWKVRGISGRMKGASSGRQAGGVSHEGLLTGVPLRVLLTPEIKTALPSG